jgi:hypothetical protein
MLTKVLSCIFARSEQLEALASTSRLDGVPIRRQICAMTDSAMATANWRIPKSARHFRTFSLPIICGTAIAFSSSDTYSRNGASLEIVETFHRIRVNEDSDAALVIASKRGDGRAFEKLVLRHERRVFAVAQHNTLICEGIVSRRPRFCFGFPALHRPGIV